MNPKHINKIQELLWFNVPKKDRDMTRPFRNTSYLDPTHVMLMHVTDETETCFGPEPITFVGDCEDNGRSLPKVPYPDKGTLQVDIPTEYLRAILDNITSDAVRLTIAEQYPLKVFAYIDTCKITALIAPRVEAE